jgi:glyoxylase-like metal-dependent hydrolase (beta-lactamase superfamily II)
MYVFNKVKNRNYKIDPVSIDENDYIINENDSDIFKKIGIDGKIVYTPGHTVDSISVILKNGDAFVGDVSMNFLNFCGIHFRPIYLYDEEKVFNSWRNIINFGAKMIYPAHGKAFTVENLEKSMYRYTKK